MIYVVFFIIYVIVSVTYAFIKEFITYDPSKKEVKQVNKRTKRRDRSEDVFVAGAVTGAAFYQQAQHHHHDQSYIEKCDDLEDVFF